MGIKIFVGTLLMVCVFSFFSEITQHITIKNTKDTPLITFSQAIMYTLNHEEVTRIVEAQSAIRYKNRDEMVKAVITSRVKNKKNEETKDTISSLKIVKKDDLYSFFEEVNYQRDNTMLLKTKELFYDVKKEIAYNYAPFQSVYNGDILNGSSFYLDNKTKFFKASQSHFEINMNKKIEKNQGKI